MTLTIVNTNAAEDWRGCCWLASPPRDGRTDGRLGCDRATEGNSSLFAHSFSNAIRTSLFSPFERYHHSIGPFLRTNKCTSARKHSAYRSQCLLSSTDDSNSFRALRCFRASFALISRGTFVSFPASKPGDLCSFQTAMTANFNSIRFGNRKL